MRRDGQVILKPDDPVWDELIADIESVVSSRYAEDPDAIFGPTYAPSVEEPGFEFGVLTRKDRQNVLADTVDWRGYEGRGISHAQQRIVISNVLDEKPQEQWLEGVFAEEVVKQEKITGFKTMVGMMRNSPDNHLFEETDGDRRPWDELSAAARLQYIARDAVLCDVPFEAFTGVVKDAIGDAGETALRVVLESQKELHAIAKLLPDDGRTESTPLVEQVKDMLDHISALERQEVERHEQRETAAAEQPTPKTGQGKLSLRDLRRASQEQERRREGQRSRPQEKER